MDPYALKSPNELLTLFTMMDGKTGNTYILKYIEGILENKGYDIVIEDNNYRLEPHIPVKKEKMYAMPIEDLLALHNKLVNKTGTQHIPDKLRKTLIRRVNSILFNRGCMIKCETGDANDFRTEHFKITFDEPIIFTCLKNALLYHKATGKDNWVVMDTNAELAKGREIHKAIFGEISIDELSERSREIVKRIKENVKSNKEKEMKNIFIKFENKHLVNYVYNKLRKELFKENSNAQAKMEAPCPFYAIQIEGKEMSVQMCVGGASAIPKDSKLFVVSAAANADIIIEEVIKEYNKIETKTFTIGSAYTGHSIPVIVYPDQVSFNNEYMTFDEFIQFRNAMLKQVGGFQVGGNDILLFTHANTGTKVYVKREEFKPIIDAILCRLNG